MSSANQSTSSLFDSLIWKHASQTKGDKGVAVEVAEVKGYELKAFRAVSTFDASIAQLRAVIMDMKNFIDWADGTKAAEVIKQISDNSQACYCEHNAPWPVKNRDGVIVQSVERISDGTVCIHLRSDNELVPIKKGLVRVQYLRGTWILNDIGAGKTKVTYQVHSDPGGNIPDWLVNTMITEAPTTTLANLHKVNFNRYSEEQLALPV